MARQLPDAPARVTVSYRGQRADGTAAGGVTDDNPADLAERLYHQRWRWADIVGRYGIVGQVVHNNYVRTWWAES